MTSSELSDALELRSHVTRNGVVVPLAVVNEIIRRLNGEDNS
jgi:hypothetical protein